MPFVIPNSASKESSRREVQATKNFSERTLTDKNPTVVLPACGVGIIVLQTKESASSEKSVPQMTILHLLSRTEFNEHLKSSDGHRIVTPYVLVDSKYPNHRFKGIGDNETVAIDKNTKRLELARFGGQGEYFSIHYRGEDVTITRNPNCSGDIIILDRGRAAHLLESACRQFSTDATSLSAASLDRQSDTRQARNQQQILKSLETLLRIHQAAAKP